MKGKSSRGQSIVEMALVTPLLLLLLVGVIDVGRAMAVKIAVTNASREGARYGSWYPGDYAGIADACQFELELNNLDAGTAEVTIVPGPGQSKATSGEAIEVTVTMNMNTFVGGLIGVDTITVRSGTQMIVFGTDD